ncbi:MAG TPA: ABC transporter substrate-binding protein [Candidatus Limnocylindria bacterium]|nr:ABC transporter substrate-binding protein [Candidatus Limnocylindria bacterium]
MTEPRDPAVSETDDAPASEGVQVVPETELRTFLIADIRGYTTYTRERGDEAGAALASRFAELVAEVVGQRDGRLLELRGDEALVVFLSARKALRAAMELQARFSVDLPLGVGIGLDAGEAIPVGEGYRGTALNLAARLCAAAGPGETLASEAVIHLAAKLDGIAYVDAHAVKLKGYRGSVRVVVVLPEDRAKGHRVAPLNGSRGPERTRWVVVGAGLAMAVVAGALGQAFFLPAGPAGPLPAAGPSEAPDPLGGASLPVLAFYNGATGELEATTQFASPRNVSFFSEGSFWIVSENPRALNRVDPATHRVEQTIPVPILEASGFNFDESSIWVTDLGSPHVVRIDKRTGVVTDFPFGTDEDQTVATDVAIGDGSVWLARPGDPSKVTRLDAVTGEVQAQIDVDAWGITFGAGGLWYWREGWIGRIDSVTNQETFDPLHLSTESWLGNIYVFGNDAWTAASDTGEVWHVDRSGREASVSLEPGVGEMASTADTVWVTNANTGVLTAIDLSTGIVQDRQIAPGHATLAVAAGDDELMVAVGPTADEAIAELPGTVLTVSTDGVPWWDPAPDPAKSWSWEVQQALYITCASLVRYPDAPVPDGWTLEPEVAAAMPSVSADGRTYTFTIRPGFRFSPPSGEEVTAETFRATIERALSPVFDDGDPGPTFYGDIVGVEEFRNGSADHISGLSVDGEKLAITLEAPSSDFLGRLALPYICPVPLGTLAVRSGLDPEPPIEGAGPYYLAEKITKRLVVFRRNPNYNGPREQPFDAIAIKVGTEPSTAIDQIQRGVLDAAMLDGFNPISGAGSEIEALWGPDSEHAADGDQRWFGAARLGVDFIALNAKRGPFADLSVRRAVSLALDRAAISSIWVQEPTADLMVPSVPGSEPERPVPAPDLDAALELMDGRTFDVTLMGYPAKWECGPCRDFEVAVTGQLKKIGINVTVRHAEDYPADALDRASGVDLLLWGGGADVPDPAALLGGVWEIPWIGEDNRAELDRIWGLDGEERVDAAAAFARSITEDQVMILPIQYPVFAFYLSDRIGCGFVQPAIGAVDLLSLCIDESPAPSPSATP